jgi:transcription initiation factor IIE alpha subunit
MMNAKLRCPKCERDLEEVELVWIVKNRQVYLARWDGDKYKYEEEVECEPIEDDIFIGVRCPECGEIVSGEEPNWGW